MAKTAQIFCKAVDSYTMILMVIEQFFMYCNDYPSILTVLTLALQNYFNMSPFLVRMQPFESYESLLSYGTVLVTHRAVLKNLRKYGENGSNILQGRRLLYNDLDAP